MRYGKALVLVISFWLAGSVALAANTYHLHPTKGKPGNRGTKKKPWGTLESVIKQGRLGKLKGGDTLLLYSGKHGNVSFSGDNAKPITIAAAPGQTPQLSRLVITKGKNWTIRGLTISPTFGDKPYKGMMVSVGERGVSSEIVVENCFVYSIADSSQWTVAQWKAANGGMQMGRHGTKLTFRNNYVLNTRWGINVASTESLVEANVVTNFSGDGMRLMKDGITVKYNVVKNAYVSAKDGDRNHDDAIQCFLFNKGTGTLRRLTLRGNLIISREDDKQNFPSWMQAIGFFDGPLIDFVVEKNVVLINHWHGISLYDAQNCKILDNAVYDRWADRMKPWIMLGSKRKLAKGNIVTNNIAPSFKLKADRSVVTENNQKSTEKNFQKRYDELLKTIEEKYGKYHPVAKYARVGTEKGEDPKVKKSRKKRKR